MSELGGKLGQRHIDRVKPNDGLNLALYAAHDLTGCNPNLTRHNS